MVGISLLTLVPGAMGGSETYARELLRALARAGELEYRVLLPPVAPDAADGLPAVVAPEYGSATTLAARLRAMTRAAVRPGSLRRRLDGASAVHYPLTVPLPRVNVPAAISLLDVQHLDLPELFTRGERAFRALAYDRVGPAGSARGRDQRVRPGAGDRAAVAGPGRACTRSTSASTTSASGRSPPSNGVRSSSTPRAPGRTRTTSACSPRSANFAARRPELRLVLTGGGQPLGGLPDGVDVRGAVSLDELVALYRRGVVPRLPEPVRGLRPAAARGDGVRLPRRGLANRRAPRGLRRRSSALRPARPRGDRGRGRGGTRSRRRSSPHAASSALRASRGSARRAPTRRSTAPSPPPERPPRPAALRGRPPRAGSRAPRT